MQQCLKVQRCWSQRDHSIFIYSHDLYVEISSDPIQLLIWCTDYRHWNAQILLNFNFKGKNINISQCSQNVPASGKMFSAFPSEILRNREFLYPNMLTCCQLSWVPSVFFKIFSSLSGLLLPPFSEHVAGIAIDLIFFLKQWIFLLCLSCFQLNTEFKSVEILFRFHKASQLFLETGLLIFHFIKKKKLWNFEPLLLVLWIMFLLTL